MRKSSAVEDDARAVRQSTRFSSRMQQADCLSQSNTDSMTSSSITFSSALARPDVRMEKACHLQSDGASPLGVRRNDGRDLLREIVEFWNRKSRVPSRIEPIVCCSRQYCQQSLFMLSWPVAAETPSSDINNGAFAHPEHRPVIW